MPVHVTSRQVKATLLLVLFGMVVFGSSSPLLRAQPAMTDGRPNVLLIITDDQRFDTMDFMPRVKERIFGQGIGFSRAYATTPLCCPSRSSILTGLFARHHGVRINADPLSKPTIANYLHDAGYYTALIGKYLNSHDKTPLSGYDYWIASEQKYIDPRINVNGVQYKHSGYQTWLLRDYALTFLEQANQQSAPFLLIFAPRAPHVPAMPAPGDELLYPDLPAYRPPSHNEVDISDKPNWVQQFPYLTDARIATRDLRYKQQLQTLKGADDAIDTLLTTLATQGKLDNTLVVFLSDNGVLISEHRLQGKHIPYQEAVKIPFAVRYPPLITRPYINSQLIANIDIVPTILDLAGIPIPSDIDGRSLRPLFTGTSSWRDELLLEGWGTTTDPLIEFTAVQTHRWVYTEIPGDISELYDLENDPYQLQNLVQDPNYDLQESVMRSRLQGYQIKNLALNDGFGLDANADGHPDLWSTNPRFTRAMNVVHNGSYAGKHVATDNTRYDVGQTVRNLSGGQTYEFSGWVNIPTTPHPLSFKIQVNWRDAAGINLGTHVIRRFSDDTAGAWKQARASMVAPAGTATGRIQMLVASPDATIFVDDFVFGMLP